MEAFGYARVCIQRRSPSFLWLHRSAVILSGCKIPFFPRNIFWLTFQVHFYGTMMPTAILIFSMTSWTFGFSHWDFLQSSPVAVEGSIYLLYCCTVVSFVAIIRTACATHIPLWVYIILVVPFTFRSIGWLAYAPRASHHPVDMLISDATNRYNEYLNSATSSVNLSAAVDNYRIRYKRDPPPGFDHWYNYATLRDSVIIDDFDRINEDLSPYWALSPLEIRQRTWLAISNPWNDVASISIRQGKAEIGSNILPTHRWMLDGVVEMINHFDQWLPDMDISFNINDESRVSLPYEASQKLREKANKDYKLNQHIHNEFSSNRTWESIPADPIQDTPFIDLSRQRTFSQYGSIGCPPSAPARISRHWDTSFLCASCTAPHSLGAFLPNWTISADVCHQPDLANLHGLYLSPAAFKATHELYPIFSQSKAP